MLTDEDKGYGVYRVGGGLLSRGSHIQGRGGYTEAFAQARCEKANAKAEILGIEARYEVRENG